MYLNPKGVILNMLTFALAFGVIGFFMAKNDWLKIKSKLYSTFMPATTIGTWAPVMNAALFALLGYMIGMHIYGRPQIFGVSFGALHHGFAAAGGDYFAETFESLLPADYYASPEHIDFANGPELQ